MAETEIGSDAFEDHDQPSRPREWIEGYPFNMEPNSEFNPHELGGLIREVFDDFGVLVTSEAIRFHEGDWTYQGEPSVACEVCGEQLHIYRRPFKAYGKEMRWWGIVCPGCPEIIGIDGLNSSNSKAVKIWDNPELASRKKSKDSRLEPSNHAALDAAGKDHLVVITFDEPVVGTDLLDESVFTSDRHRVHASKIVQDPEITRFIDDDGVIRAEWPTRNVLRIRWIEEPSPSGLVTPNASEYQARIAAIKEKHPNAYSPWTETSDTELREAVLQGLSVLQISQALQRQPGGIRSRISKLGLDLQQSSTSPNAD